MFLDTNVLIRARFEAAPGHIPARQRIQAAGDRREALRISRQVLREYLATVTRPLSWSVPITTDAALACVAALEIPEDGPRVTQMLKRLYREVSVAGRQVHDANLAATMLAYGERRLLTFNTRDSRRYGERIELIDTETAP